MNLSPKELAERWRMNVRTLTNWRTQGRGPAFIKLGGGRNTKVLYRLEDVIAFEQQHLKGIAC